MVAAVAAMSGCGGDDTRPDPFTAVEKNDRAGSARRGDEAAPRWDRVTTLRGSGDARKRIRIKPDAVQWRVRWRCTKGRLRVIQRPAPAEGNPVGGGRCRGADEASSIDTGKLLLVVRAKGRWRAVVEQQVTDPIAEPPLPAMKSEDAAIVSRGRFYGIDRRGRGKALLYELPKGRLALRFEGFRTTNNTDLFVWLTAAARPRTTKQALRSDHLEFARLKSTIGSQNYLIPTGIDAEAIRSIVIWSEPLRIAYAAATLR